MVDREGSPVPPDAPQVPFVREFHGDRVEDPYHWMADKSDQRFLDYLAAENAYTDAMTAHLGPLREDLFEDISSRTKQTDLSVPGFITHVGGRSFWYYTRTTEGLDYQAHYRLPATDRDHIPEVTHAPAGEQLVLDVNQLAQGTDFLALGLADLSPDGNLIAYSTDTEGDERFLTCTSWMSTAARWSRGRSRVSAEAAPGSPTSTCFTCASTTAGVRTRCGGIGSERPSPRTSWSTAKMTERFFVAVDASAIALSPSSRVASKITGETHLIPAADPTAALATSRPVVMASITTSRWRRTGCTSRTTPTIRSSRCRRPRWTPHRR